MILVDVILLPVRAVKGTAADILAILKTWKQYALEYEATYRRQQVCKHDIRLLSSADVQPLLRSQIFTVHSSSVLTKHLRAAELQGKPTYRGMSAPLAACQVEDSRKAYRAAEAPEEAEALRKQTHSQDLTKRRPAPLKIEAEDAALTDGLRHARRLHRRGSKVGTKWKPKPSSSVQVKASFLNRFIHHQLMSRRRRPVYKPASPQP